MKPLCATTVPETEGKNSEPILTRRVVSGSAARVRKANVLVVDDEPAAGKLLSARLKLAGFRSAAAPSGAPALQVLQNTGFDAVICSSAFCEHSGIAMLKEVRSKHPYLAFLMLLRSEAAHVGVRAMKEGADDYLVKPLNPRTVFRTLRRSIERKRLERQLGTSLSAGVSGLAMHLHPALRQFEEGHHHACRLIGAALELQDLETVDHSRRVCMYSLEMAKRMRGFAGQVQSLGEGAYLHDIGKLGIPDAILQKPAALTAEERALMQTHVTIGYNLVRGIPSLRGAAELILTHHERYDGGGYPRGLRRQQIPLGSRIFAVADSFDAMTTERPYQSARPVSAARETIRALAGADFDPAVVESFLAIPVALLEEIQMKAGDRAANTDGVWSVQIGLR